MTDNTGTSTVTLDVLDRVTQIVPSGGRKTATLSYFIDLPIKAWKVRTSLAGVSGFWETLEDTKGRPYQQLNPLNQVFTTEYFRDGQPWKQWYPNGTQEEYQYHPRGTLYEIALKKNGGALLDRFRYAYDLDGRVLTETDLGGQVHGFAYDPLGQLSSETHPDLGSGIFYHFDAHGNRTQVIEDGVIEYYKHDLADKLEWTNTNGNTTPSAGQNKKYGLFEYDGFGQLSKRDRRVKTGGSRKTHHFAWDTQGRLRQVKDGNTVKFTALYAGDGERVEKTDAATGSHIFSFGLQDTGDGGTLYTPGLSQRRGSTDRFFHHDWLGSSRYLTNAAGNDAPSAYRYSAFGKLSAQDGPDDQTYFGFAGAWGYETEAQGGFDLQYLYQRYYDPHIGRFISRDPIRWAGGLNLYGYTGNDPVGFVDPFGAAPTPLHVLDEFARDADRLDKEAKKPIGGPVDPPFLGGGLAVRGLAGVIKIARAARVIKVVGQGYRRSATFRGPAAKDFDWTHIVKHHAEWGQVAAQRIKAAGRNADSIFWNMSEDQIKACVTGAWRNRKRIDSQVDKVDGVVIAIKYRGVDPVSNKTIDFWYDVASKQVKTAFPPAGK